MNMSSESKHAARPSNGGSAPVAAQEVSISDLRAAVKGQVIAPDDAGYDQGRAVFYGGIDRYPAAIVRVADASDVSRVVTLARETGVELAVRSGGHSVAGHGVSEGGIVLDLSNMKALDIDHEARTAWAETGSVGIGGITLGGGVGFLVRKYGLTIDDLLAAEIVTADGQILHVSADSHPDLFWAIQGGGGNFGVATRFKCRLQPVETVVGGMLILPATPDVIAGFIAEAEAAPEELSAIANVMVAPPMPFLPPEAHGKLIVMGMLVYAGEVEAGERALAPFRALAEPIADMLKPMSYPEIYPPEPEDYHPVAAARTLFMDQVGKREAELIVERLQASTAMMAVTQLRVLGGAMARVPADATAFAHRSRRIMANVAALVTQPEELSAHEPWVADFAAALTNGEAGAYVNFLGNEGEERVREAYPGQTWDRLRAVKARYDPHNLFRLNQNIPPAS